MVSVLVFVLDLLFPPAPIAVPTIVPTPGINKVPTTAPVAILPVLPFLVVLELPCVLDVVICLKTGPAHSYPTSRNPTSSNRLK